jgi:hypothetical protein
MIKNTSPSISSVVAALLALSIVGATTTTISQLSSIDVVKSAYAFPCKGGTGGEYCRGYHDGAIQADKSLYSSLAPAIIEAFNPPIEVPAIISIFILLFARALNTPHPKALKEPPP